MPSSEGQQLMEAFDRLSQSIESRGRSSNTSSIRIDAGGAAVWMATTACLVMLGMMFVGGLWMSYALMQASEERAENRAAIRDIGDYVSAIYQVAPDLQKRIEAKKDNQKDRE